MNPLLEAACWYARQGWAVFPLHDTAAGYCSCKDGSSCTSAGKHPRIGGWQSEPATEEQIRKWWAQWPNANIGGYCYEHEVLDVDMGGEETLAMHEPIGTTWEARTPKGGSHLYFLPAPVPMLNAVKLKTAPGLDFRAKGRGFTVLPPSVVAAGKWTWKNRPDEVRIIECPDWIAETFEDKQENKAPAIPEKEIKEGARNDKLYKFACRLRRDGLEETELYAALVAVNKRCSPPLPDSDLHTIAHSAATYKPAPIQEQTEVELPETARCGWIGEFMTTGRKRGTPSGFGIIDNNTTTKGFPEGQLSCIAAYTGVGKSAVMGQMAGQLAKEGNSVCFATFADLTAEDLYDRLVKNLSGWYGGDPPENEQKREAWEEARREVNTWKIYVYDASDMFTGHGIERFRDWFMQNETQFSIVCLDYAQEIETEDRTARSEHEQAKAVCKVARAMAGRTRIPFVVLSQVTEGRDGARDITKGSRIWEEKAAIVLKIKSIEGEELAKSDFPGMPGLHLAHLAKNRFGPSNLRSYLQWKPDRMVFEEL